jgi:2'-5' RNA ligase
MIPSPGHRRLFLAIDLPDAWRHPLFSAGQAAARVHGGQATGEENLHVTVAFFGSVGEGDVARLGEGLASIIEKTPAFVLRSPCLVWGPLGLEPRMLWTAWRRPSTVLLHPSRR